jgi:hypothetical protein
MCLRTGKVGVGKLDLVVAATAFNVKILVLEAVWTVIMPAKKKGTKAGELCCWLVEGKAYLPEHLGGLISGVTLETIKDKPCNKKDCLLPPDRDSGLFTCQNCCCFLHSCCVHTKVYGDGLAMPSLYHDMKADILLSMCATCYAARQDSTQDDKEEFNPVPPEVVDEMWRQKVAALESGGWVTTMEENAANEDDASSKFSPMRFTRTSPQKKDNEDDGKQGDCDAAASGEEDPSSMDDHSEADFGEDSGKQKSLPGAEPFVVEETGIRRTRVVGNLSFAYLQRGAFPESTFQPDRTQYDMECQSVSFAADGLLADQCVDKKLKNIMGKRRNMRGTQENAVVKARLDSTYKQVGLLKSVYVPETAALSHMDAIKALCFYPKQDVADSYFTGLVQDKKGVFYETEALCTNWVHRSFEKKVTRAVEKLG